MLPLGCIGHIIHLAAKQGLKALELYKSTEIYNANVIPNDPITEYVRIEDEFDEDLDSLSSVTGTIMFRVHSLVVSVRSSPQRRAAFHDIAKVTYNDEKDMENLC